ncbi:MAG: hypothetical protein JXQ75_17615 [Phycisphaerae bacterium]|nr:hypothetical protein [Phycisphaerae bacterium]
MFRILLAVATQLALMGVPTIAIGQEPITQPGSERGRRGRSGNQEDRPTQPEAPQARASRGRARDAGVPVINPVVFRLRHASCFDVARMIEELAPQTSSYADARTNSVIYNGSSDTVEAIRSLIEELDRPIEENQASEVAIVRVLHRGPGELAERILQTLGSRQCQLRIAADEGRSSILMSGPEPQLDTAKRILDQLDTPPATVNLEIAFFQAHLDYNKDDLNAKIPADLADVAKELDRFGPHELLGRLSTIAVEHERFSVEGSISQNVTAMVKGELISVSPDTEARLRIETFLRLERARPTDEEGKAQQRGPSPTFQLETVILTKRGDYLILGSAPTGWDAGESVILVLHLRP